MNINIDNCYEWVGFHIANDMLEHGWTVYSKSSPENVREDNLAMFLGRNSRFHVGHISGNADARISIDEDCIAGPSLTVLTDERELHVSCPYLIGEWMPWKQPCRIFEGHEKELVSAYELSDFLIQSLRTNIPSGHVEFISRYSEKVQSDCSGIAVSLSDLRPSEKMMRVKNHYERFRHLYI